jgi:Na+-driven multidrug efflux pump
VTIVLNRLTVSYGDIPLAAMGIVLKIERIPINIGLGVCLGMVPLIAYNYGAGNTERMKQFFSLSRLVILSFSGVCAMLFLLFAQPLLASFISDTETVEMGAGFLRGRCFALPFMMIGYHIVNYMNAIGKGKISFLLAILRHLVLIVPIMLLMNAVWKLDGLVWSQLAADFLNAGIALLLLQKVEKRTA